MRSSDIYFVLDGKKWISPPAQAGVERSVRLQKFKSEKVQLPLASYAIFHLNSSSGTGRLLARYKST